MEHLSRAVRQRQRRRAPQWMKPRAQPREQRKGQLRTAMPLFRAVHWNQAQAMAHLEHLRAPAWLQPRDQGLYPQPLLGEVEAVAVAARAPPSTREATPRAAVEAGDAWTAKPKARSTAEKEEQLVFPTTYLD